MSILHLRPRKDLNAEVVSVSFEEYIEAVSAHKSLVRETFVMQKLTRQVSERLRAIREVHPQYATWEERGRTTTPIYRGKEEPEPQPGPD